MSLYAQYIKERLDKRSLESDKGFITYRFFEDLCYIEDIFVSQEHRHQNIAADMADKVSIEAKEHRCKAIICSVVPSANFCTDSLKAALAYGFRINSAANNLIVLRKEL
jgi:predicted GNAT family acetyltransferase